MNSALAQHQNPHLLLWSKRHPAWMPLHLEMAALPMIANKIVDCADSVSGCHVNCKLIWASLLPPELTCLGGQGSDRL